MLKVVLEILSLLAVGTVAGAEIGSWFGIQPIIAKLPYEQQVNLEQAMLKTFGKVMPFIMPLSAVIVIVLAILSCNDPDDILWLRIISAGCIAITIVTTLTINVPINSLTTQWHIREDFKKWSEMRTRWHLFQGLRGGLFMISFVLLTIASII